MDKKTKEEILLDNYVILSSLPNMKDSILNAMQQFSDQENTELSEQLLGEIVSKKNIENELIEISQVSYALKVQADELAEALKQIQMNLSGEEKAHIIATEALTKYRAGK